MLIFPRPLWCDKVDYTTLRADYKEATKYGRVRLSRKRLYMQAPLGVRYVPLKNITRAYKRLAVSKGFFSDKKVKVFATLPYLVIRNSSGTEKVTLFKFEEELDELLMALKTHTDIPIGKP